MTDSIDWNNRDNELLTCDEKLSQQCSLDFYKSTGKGGQKKNKTSSSVRLVHKATGIEATSGNRRSQKENRAIALKQMKMNLALSWRNVPAQKWDGNFNLNEKNPQFPLLAATVLDHIYEHGWQVSAAAQALGLSTGQLIKFLKKHVDLWQKVNQERERIGLNKLK